MQNAKPLEFKGTPGGYFVLGIVSFFLAYIPLFGWAFLFNYAMEWFADNTLVNGKRVKYSAEYGETLGFVFVNGVLLVVTFGIYVIWFGPKMYRYVANHTQYTDAVPTPVGAPQPATPAQ